MKSLLFTITHNLIKRPFMCQNSLFSLSNKLRPTLHGMLRHHFNSKSDLTVTKNEGQLVIKGWLKKTEKKSDHLQLTVTNGGLPSNRIIIIVPNGIESSYIATEAAIIIVGTKLDETKVFTIVAQKIEIKKSRTLSKRFLNKFYSDIFVQNLRPHLRPKLASYALQFHLRSKLRRLLRQYFYERNFIEVDTPTLTRTVVDAFHKTLHVEKPSWDTTLPNPFISEAFGHPVYLSPSGQLHLQCFASGLRKVFSIAPSFRTHYSSGKYVYEFWTTRVEEVFLGKQEEALDALITSVESFLKHLLEILVKDFDDQETTSRIQSYLEARWERLTYTEAINIMNQDEELQRRLNFNICFGNILPLRGLNVVMKKFGGPVLITRFPPNIKQFNVALDTKSNETLTFQVMFPNIGPVVSGAIWEHDADRLQQSLKLSGGSYDYLSWYFGTRKWGVAPTRGFCLGIDSFMTILFPGDIKKGIPFPRSQWNCVG